MMTRRIFLLGAATVAVACTPSSGVREPGAMRAPAPVVSPREGSAVREARSHWVDSTLRRLTLRDKVAQLVWPWIIGDYVPEGSAEWGRLKRLVQVEKVGGFIVSVGGPLDIAAKVNALQELSDLPLLMSADLETGVGFRARGGYFVPNAIDLGGATNFPLQMALGAANDTALAYELGRVTAIEGRALGLHIAFGPVLDVNNNPANPVIGARSVSENPQLTARMGVAVTKGLQENGMLATGKHFPGHGDTETNSHLALASVTAPRARLDSVELYPFRQAIAGGIGAIMTFHGFLPALDSAQVPATLSPKVMTQLLRRDLGFDGLLVTDAMDMRGVVDRFGAFEAAKMAIAAGNDVLLMPSDIKGTIDAVVAGVSEGRYTEARIDQSVRRLLELKHRLGLPSQRLVALENVRRVVGDSANTVLAQRLADKSFTLVVDSANTIPFTRRGGAAPKVLTVTYARRAELSAGGAFNAEFQRLGGVRNVFVNADESTPDLSRPVAEASQADVVVINSYVNITSETATADAPRAFIGFVNQLLAQRKRVVVVSFGTPYLISQIPGVSAYGIAWGSSTASQRAAARALLGEIPIQGRLPISIPGFAALGAGVSRIIQE